MALYNNFPATYQQYVPVYQQPAQMNSNLIWVQGEAGAKSYLVAPNTTVQLWDSERQCIYLKSADASGMPSMKVLDYTIRDNHPAPAPVTAQTEYATKEDVNVLYNQISGIRAEIDSLTARKAHAKKEEEHE